MIHSQNTKTENMKYIGKSIRVRVFLIFLAVYLFNSPYIFFDGLWHDDGYWFYQATEGEIIDKSRSKVSALVPLMDYLYSKGMVILGTDVLRFLYIGIMSLGSILAYGFYRNALELKDRIALPAAILPNVLPSLIIPLGFNASYAVWEVPFLFLTLIVLYRAINSQDGKEWGVYYWVSLLLFLITVNVSGAGTFLIPNVLMLFMLLIGRKPLIKIFINALPFIVFSIYHVYKHSKYSHKSPVLNSADVVLDRAVQFLDMSNIYLLEQYAGVVLVLALICWGFVAIGVADGRQYIFRKAVGGKYRSIIISWLFVWLVANSVAYILLSPTFRPYDYAYIFNFVSILLQIIGINYLLYMVVATFFRGRIAKSTTAYLALIIIIGVGIQRMQAYYETPQIEQIERTTAEIRALLAPEHIPEAAQILILNMTTPHQGVIDVNSGYIRYITSRYDVNALIGPDKFPLNPFKRKGGWRMAPMTGLKRNRPIMAFRYDNGVLEKVNYLLEANLERRSGDLQLLWRLYDISDWQALPVEIHAGTGIDDYKEFIYQKHGDIVPYIAFSQTRSLPG